MKKNIKKAIFVARRCQDLGNKLPELKKYFQHAKKTSAIIAPFIVRGEIIGIIEFLSPRLAESNLKLYENFTANLIKSMSSGILFDEIKQAKEHYKIIIDTIQDGLCVIDKDYRIAGCNQAFAKRVNKNFSEIKGHPCREIIPYYEHELLGKHCVHSNCDKICSAKDVFQTGQTKHFTEKSQDKKGRIHFHNISIFPAKNTQGKIYQVVMTIRDATKRREAENRIHQLSEFNQRILDNSPVSIVVLDKQGVIVSANDLAKQLMEKPRRKLAGRKLTDTKEIKKNPYLKKQYRTLLEKGESLFFENLSYQPEDRSGKKCLNIIAVPLFDDKKRTDGAISMAIDNTEAVRAKEKLEDLNRHLEEKVLERTQELDEINKKLKQAIALKSKFISDASHELRTPLTVIQGNLDLAVREAQKRNCQAPESFNLILGEVERMTSVLSDLTVLTNADSNSEFLLHEKINLNELVTAVAKSLKVLADQKKIAITYKKGLKNITIIGDEAKLEKLLLNIVRNAIKYTEPKGKINIWLDNNGAEACIHVSDTGIGIPEQDLPFIFERFYRVDKARSRDEGGTGLGLSICKWIAHLHNGRITVKSQVSKGTTFTVHLPREHKRSK